MKVLITGANGMVARAMIAHSQQKGDETFAYTRQELDIGDREKVFERFEKDGPDAVFNCAAFTDVDGAETDELVCRRVNGTGVENLALAAKKIDCRLVTVSTDYVFDGTKGDFYTQKDTPNPQGIYAKTKFEGERLAQKAYARSIIVRSGWIYGRGGTNFLSVMPKLLAEGKNITAISDSYGTPTYAEDLAVRLRELAILDLPAVFHIVNSGDGTSFSGFAEKVCEIKGFAKTLIEPVSADGLRRPAPRPADSRLKCLFSERFGLAPMPGWQAALERFIDH